MKPMCWIEGLGLESLGLLLIDHKQSLMVSEWCDIWLQGSHTLYIWWKWGRKKLNSLLWNSVTKTKLNNLKSITQLLIWLAYGSLFGSMKWPDQNIMHLIIWVYTWLDKPVICWQVIMIYPVDICNFAWHVLKIPYFWEPPHSQFDSGVIFNNFTTLPLLSWQYSFPS